MLRSIAEIKEQDLDVWADDVRKLSSTTIPDVKIEETIHPVKLSDAYPLSDLLPLPLHNAVQEIMSFVTSAATRREDVPAIIRDHLTTELDQVSASKASQLIRMVEKISFVMQNLAEKFPASMVTIGGTERELRDVAQDIVAVKEISQAVLNKSHPEKPAAEKLIQVTNCIEQFLKEQTPELKPWHDEPTPAIRRQRQALNDLINECHEIKNSISQSHPMGNLAYLDEKIHEIYSKANRLLSSVQQDVFQKRLNEQTGVSFAAADVPKQKQENDQATQHLPFADLIEIERRKVILDLYKKHLFEEMNKKRPLNDQIPLDKPVPPALLQKLDSDADTEKLLGKEKSVYVKYAIVKDLLTDLNNPNLSPAEKLKTYAETFTPENHATLADRRDSVAMTIMKALLVGITFGLAYKSLFGKERSEGQKHVNELEQNAEPPAKKPRLR
ncbi:MAG TPA: hypothetical protein VLJ15_00720 [Gammaproteobacteria bacterium]|nr:hypothetical protein [Gammaproteobacteria bacterium]